MLICVFLCECVFVLLIRPGKLLSRCGNVISNKMPIADALANNHSQQQSLWERMMVERTREDNLLKLFLWTVYIWEKLENKLTELWTVMN